MTFSPPHLLESERWSGLRVGLLGGSFNPPHEGHLHISLSALRVLKLDFVWWLVTPQNPLKEAGQLLPYGRRLELCRAMISHPRILATDLERRLGVNRTFDTVTRLKRVFSRTEFVFLSGHDIAMEFHRWYRWRGILKEITTAHFARPPAQSLAQACPLRMVAEQRHSLLPQPGSPDLRPGRSYWVLQGVLVDMSSTEIREKS